MEMNVEKTKVMRISRQPSQLTIMIDQKQLENMECFKYLKTILSVSQTEPFLLCCYTHLGDMFRLIFKSSSGPFLRYRFLSPTLKMHYGIPNA